MISFSLVVVIFVIIPQHHCNASQSVHISKLKGIDTPLCGNDNSQCKSLSYAVNNIVKENDSVALNLDGGINSRITYTLTDPLQINVSMVILKQYNSVFNPILTVSDDDSVGGNNSNLSTMMIPFVFEYTSENILIFRLESIDFKNVNIFGIEKGNVSFSINNCTIDNSRMNRNRHQRGSHNVSESTMNSTTPLHNQTFSEPNDTNTPDLQNHVSQNISERNRNNTLKQIPTNTFSTQHISIINSTVNCNNKNLLNDKHPGRNIESITIKNTILIGCSVVLNSKTTRNYLTPLKLNIEESIFQGNTNMSALYINRTTADIKLNQIKFSNHDGRFGQAVLYVQTRTPSIGTLIFWNISFENNQNVSFLTQLRYLHVNGTLLFFKNNTLCNGIVLKGGSGNINNVTAIGNQNFGYCVIAESGERYNFGDIFILNNRFTRTAILSIKSTITINSLVIKDTAFTYVGRAFSFRRTQANITSIDMRNITVLVGEVLVVRYGNVNIGSYTLKDSTVYRSVFLSIVSKITINSLVVKDTILTCLRQAVSFIVTQANVTSIYMENITVPKAEVLEITRANVIIDSYILKNSTIFQSVFQNHGSLQVKMAIFHGNINFASMVGSVNAELIQFQNVDIRDNLIGGRLFHAVNVKQINFKQIHILNNGMKSIFHILKGNLCIQNVFIKYNIVREHNKVLSFTDEGVGAGRKQYNVTIKTFSAIFRGFEGKYESHNFFEIDLRNSNLTMENTSLTIQDIHVPSIKVFKLIFATKNRNIHPEINVMCPTNYDISEIPPIVKVATIEYVVGCHRCPKDTYSLLRGQLKLKDVINNSNIDTTWVTPHDIKKIISTNQSNTLQCFPCPPGGDCLNGTRSQGNYYGYISKSKINLNFISCPSQYCCSKLGKECTSYDTCNKNRRGVLCGECEDGFYQSIFSSNCVNNKQCTKTKQSIFWSVFTLSTILLVFIICFIQDILTVFRYICEKAKKMKKHRVCDDYDKANSNKTIFQSDCKKNWRLSSWMSWYDHIDFNIKTRKQEDPLERRRVQKEHPLEVFSVNGIPYKNECYKPSIVQSCTVAGFVQILISFFQIEALTYISLEVYSNANYELLSDIFNFELLVYEVDALCPFHSIGAIGKLLFRKLLLFLAMIIVTTISLLIVFTLKYTKDLICKNKKNPMYQHKLCKYLRSLPLRYKLGLTYLKIILFAYKNIVFVSLTLMTCPYVNNQPVLYIDGNIQCYKETWQIFNYIFFVTWILPLPLALPFLYDLIKNEAITLWHFLFCLVVPLATPYWYFKGKNQTSHYLEQLNDRDSIITHEQNDQKKQGHHCRDDHFGKGDSHHNKKLHSNNRMNRGVYNLEILKHLYAIFEEPYRAKGSLYVWVSIGLYERLIVAFLSSVMTDPIKRLCIITVVIVLFLWLHCVFKPYKKEMKLLKLLDITSYICLAFHTTMNLFRAVVYNFDISTLVAPTKEVLDLFTIFGYIITPLGVFIVYLIYKAMSSVIKVFSDKKEN